MADLSGVTTTILPTVDETFADNLSNSAGSGDVTVSLNNSAPYSDGDIVALTVDPDTAKQATFTGEVSGNSIVNVKWTEGNLGASHDIGAVVVDYVSATHYALISKHLGRSLNADGTLKNEVVTASKLDFTTLAFGNYSTSEVNTGFKWIDGKAIYKKSFSGTITAAANVRNIATIGSYPSVDTLVRAEGMFYGGGEYIAFGSAHVRADGTANRTMAIRADNQLITYSDTARTNAPYSFTIYYTKTT